MTKMILQNKQQINYILTIFFLLVTFIHLIKQESETNRCVDYSNYSEKTYPEFVVDPNDNPDLLFYKFSSLNTYQNIITPINGVNYTPNQSTLNFTIYDFLDYSFNLSPIYFPKTKIIKILQKKNICHKSSDDNPVPYVCC